MILYCASFKFHNTGQVATGKYESATARALAIICYSGYADVVDQWAASVADDGPEAAEAKLLSGGRVAEA